MNKKNFFGFILFSNFFFSQVGIGTARPLATLHLEPSSKSVPSASDGILIPSVMQLPSSPQSKGQLVFLTGPITNQGFYYWDGSLWQKIVVGMADITEAEYLCVVGGNGLMLQNTNSTDENTVVINSILTKVNTGFSFPTPNTLRIGKTGTYFINFVSGLKANVGINRASFIYRLKKNGTTVVSSSSSVPNESSTATSISMGSFLKLNSGDLLSVTVQKEDESTTNNVSYSGYGNNSLQLTFLHN